MADGTPVALPGVDTTAAAMTTPPAPPVLMPGGTSIEWCHFTFNPWWGCVRVSPACTHCYAETLAKRTGHDVWGKTSDRRLFADGHWSKPEKWNRDAERDGVRYRVFCASMADVFEGRDDLNEQRARLFDLIAATPWLDWLLLTKRPQLVRDLVPLDWLDQSAHPCTCEVGDLRFPQVHGPTCRQGSPWPFNVWIGTTVEDQERADERIPHLAQIPAPVRFLSCEPLLGPLDLSRWLGVEWMDALRLPAEPRTWRTENGDGGWGMAMEDALSDQRSPIDWIIAGGESGGHARPMHPGWARDLHEQARAAEVPFLFKQWGDWCPAPWRVEQEPGEDRDDYKDRAQRVGATHSMRPDGNVHQFDHRPWSLERSSADHHPLAGIHRVGKKAAGRELDGSTLDGYPVPRR